MDDNYRNRNRGRGSRPPYHHRQDSHRRSPPRSSSSRRDRSPSPHRSYSYDRRDRPQSPRPSYDRRERERERPEQRYEQRYEPTYEPQPEPYAGGSGDSGPVPPPAPRGPRPDRPDRFDRYKAASLRTRPEGLISKKGSGGQPVRLRSNYFELTSVTNWTIIQHHVDMVPDVELTKDKKILMRAQKPNIGGYLFDGTALYTTARLKTPMELHGTHPSSGETIKIIIRDGQNLQVGDYHYLQVFNILMRRCFEYLKLKLIGRDFYDRDQAISISAHGLELWPGYRTTISQHENSILMVADIIHKVVRSETAYDILMRTRNSHDPVNAFKAEIIGKIVLTGYNNKTYKVDDVDFKNTPMSTFPYKDGNITYVDYYKQKYNISIKSKSQPLLVSRAKARDVRAGMSEIIYLIPETCLLTGFTDSMRQNFRLMKDVSTYTNVTPSGRAQKLRQFNRRLLGTDMCVQDFREWNLTLDSNLVKIDARQLDAENIIQGSNRSYSAGRDNFYFNKELRSNKLYAMPSVGTWAVIIPERCSQPADRFVQMIHTAARGMDISLRRAEMFYINNDNVQSYIPELEKVISRLNPQFILCCVSNDNAQRYAAIKKKCYVDRGVPVQVVTMRVMTNKNAMSIATNVLVQIACKIGGTPWHVEVPLSASMIVGYDVSHDAQDKSKSYGAMVATLDRGMTHYYSTVNVHRNGEELANEFAINIVKAAHEFTALNKSLPKTVVIFRDGVGEGQIPYVYDYEVNTIKAALSKIYGGDTYKLAFIIVTKRINTKFFMDGNFDNPRPGTIIDDVVTLPQRYDFYLVSQTTRVGTVSPTSYNIIFDNTGLQPKHFQLLAYKLCHMYFNYTGPIRVPAVCHNAHKLAFLVGQHLHNVPNSNLRSTLYYL